MPALAFANGTYDPGASDTEIKIGTTWAFSGPGSVTAPLERQMAAYFRMVNEHGGVNGRKIDLIALDDGYIPAKTVEATRRLVELDQVLFMYGQLGTPTNIAVQPYLNATKSRNCSSPPGPIAWSIRRNIPGPWASAASYALESRVFAKYILATHPNAKVGVLYQQDDFGSDHSLRSWPRLGQGRHHGGGARELRRHRPERHLADHLDPRGRRRHALCHGAEPRGGAGGVRGARPARLERADLHVLCRHRQERRRNPRTAS